MDRFLAAAMEMAKPNWTVGHARILAAKFHGFYVQGVMESAEKAKSWGRESCGGSGQGGEGYNNLAASIQQLVNSR